MEFVRPFVEISSKLKTNNVMMETQHQKMAALTFVLLKRTLPASLILMLLKEALASILER